MTLEIHGSLEVMDSNFFQDMPETKKKIFDIKISFTCLLQLEGQR